MLAVLCLKEILLLKQLILSIDNKLHLRTLKTRSSKTGNQKNKNHLFKQKEPLKLSNKAPKPEINQTTNQYTYRSVTITPNLAVHQTKMIKMITS